MQPLSLQTTLREILADMMMIVVMQELNSAICPGSQIWCRSLYEIHSTSHSNTTTTDMAEVHEPGAEIELIVDNDERVGFVVAVDSWDKHLGPGGVHFGEGGGGGVMGLGVESRRDLNQYM
ncbi:hypothetical protein FIBSPDRAFT_1010137 [Athelia psychrophila]|uniref:Uncharacterized protein n=1 Tax=Athelia psychrophila TaxID=1759441 RepID=A0A167UY53_9AGAM|nr:hypothetical protein FIBSPDRAFT_1010137 [Fibularhizoctonia sp. CBS 109695]